jgi:hypothetical protein
MAALLFWGGSVRVGQVERYAEVWSILLGQWSRCQLMAREFCLEE